MKNALVLALDNKTRDFAEGRGMAAFMMKLQVSARAWRAALPHPVQLPPFSSQLQTSPIPLRTQAPESQQPGGARTMIGALKFRIMAACLDLGYSVLFSGGTPAGSQCADPVETGLPCVGGRPRPHTRPHPQGPTINPFPLAQMPMCWSCRTRSPSLCETPMWNA